jgi:hypothetical protein
MPKVVGHGRSSKPHETQGLGTRLDFKGYESRNLIEASESDLNGDESGGAGQDDHGQANVNVADMVTSAMQIDPHQKDNLWRRT